MVLKFIPRRSSFEFLYPQTTLLYNQGTLSIPMKRLKFTVLLIALSSFARWAGPLSAVDWDTWMQEQERSDSSGAKETNKAINKAVKKMSKKLSKGVKVVGESIAVSHFVTPSNKVTVLGNLFSEKLIDQISDSGKYVPVERDFIFKLTEEMKLGMSGMVEDKSVQKAGRLLGAPYVLIGTIQNVGEDIVVDARLVKTETSQIIKTVDTSFKANQEALKLLSHEIELVPSPPKREETVASIRKPMEASPPVAEINVPSLTSETPQHGASPSQKILILNQAEYESQPGGYNRASSNPTSADDQEMKKENDEFYQKRLEDLKQVDRKSEMMNEQAAQKDSARIQQVDEEAKAVWAQHQRDRQIEIQNLNRQKFIIIAPRGGHSHHKRRT